MIYACSACSYIDYICTINNNNIIMEIAIKKGSRVLFSENFIKKSLDNTFDKELIKTFGKFVLEQIYNDSKKEWIVDSVNNQNVIFLVYLIGRKIPVLSTNLVLISKPQ